MTKDDRIFTAMIEDSNLSELRTRPPRQILGALMLLATGGYVLTAVTLLFLIGTWTAFGITTAGYFFVLCALTAFGMLKPGINPTDTSEDPGTPG